MNAFLSKVKIIIIGKNHLKLFYKLILIKRYYISNDTYLIAVDDAVFLDDVIDINETIFWRLLKNLQFKFLLYWLLGYYEPKNTNLTLSLWI